MNRLSKLLRTASVALTIGYLAVPAKAVIVTIDSQQYDVTTTSGTVSGLSAILQSQPWWGKEPLAESLAIVVGDRLGLPNKIGFDFGPLFVYGLSDEDRRFQSEAFLSTQPTFPVNVGADVTWPATFAIVKPNNVPDAGATIAMFSCAIAGIIALRRRHS